MKRSIHNLSHYALHTFDMGELIPVGHLEVLPGDSVKMATSCLLRVSPLMTPVMHPVNVRIHHWFVPYRVLWEGWEDFITGGPDGLSETMPTYTVDGSMGQGTLTDYLGIPPGYTGTVTKFPFQAYQLIWNEFYRDQDLQPEADIDTDVSLKRVAWEKDRFTQARPWTQKGPDVTLPIGATAPVVSAGDGRPTWQNQATTYTSPLTSIGASAEAQWGAGPNPNGVQDMYWNQTRLEADLTQATSSTINDVRLAFALQRYQEARAQYGSRYTEYLRYLGVRSSDARLQRPEYLGGGRSTISFSEVLRTGNESTASEGEGVIGEMRGHGISAMRSRSFVRFFEEHGVVMSLASLRPRTMYMDGLHRSWLRRTKEDYWQKELELIGQEEVYKAELWAQSADPMGPFGYNDRFGSYRHKFSYVSSDFRTTMNDWHLSRSFAAEPVLNGAFIECVPSKRIHAEQTADVIWGMFNHNVRMRRLVGKKTIGRII